MYLKQHTVVQSVVCFQLLSEQNRKIVKWSFKALLCITI